MARLSSQCRRRLGFGHLLDPGGQAAGVLAIIAFCVSLVATASHQAHQQQHQITGSAAATSTATTAIITTTARPVKLDAHASTSSTPKYISNSSSRGRGASSHANESPTRKSAKAGVETPAASYSHRLPTWFNFEWYKQLHGKHYRRFEANELHKRVYLQTALKVLEQRALFRAGKVRSLATLNELSDLTSEQLEALRDRRTPGASSSSKRPSQERRGLPECCSYDQVYERIIGLLDSALASGAESSGGSTLARALMDELEQKPLLRVDDYENDDGGGKDDAGETGAAENADGQPDGTLDASEARRLSVAARRVADGSINSASGVELSHTSGERAAKSEDASRLSFGTVGNVFRANEQRRTTAPTPKVGQVAGARLMSTRAPTSSTRSASTTDLPATTQSPVDSIAAAIGQQLAEQFSNPSPNVRQLNKELSEYYGEPVRIRVRQLAPGASHRTTQVESA